MLIRPFHISLQSVIWKQAVTSSVVKRCPFHAELMCELVGEQCCANGTIRVRFLYNFDGVTINSYLLKGSKHTYKLDIRNAV